MPSRVEGQFGPFLVGEDFCGISHLLERDALRLPGVFCDHARACLFYARLVGTLRGRARGSRYGALGPPRQGIGGADAVTSWVLVPGLG